MQVFFALPALPLSLRRGSALPGLSLAAGALLIRIHEQTYLHGPRGLVAATRLFMPRIELVAKEVRELIVGGAVRLRGSGTT